MKAVASLILASFFAAPAFAQTCSSGEQALPLRLTYPAQAPLKNPVDVRFALDGSNLLVHFEVRTPEINAKPQLGPKEYPYQHDVVEVFVSVAGMESAHVPYYEFELSPYNQTFQVKIVDLKKPFIDGVDMGLQHKTAKTAQGWSGDMLIPLEKLGWDGDPSKVIGNAYAIFGKTGARSFWSLSIPPQAKPNFHKPEFFKPLLKCE